MCELMGRRLHISAVRTYAGRATAYTSPKLIDARGVKNLPVPVLLGHRREGCRVSPMIVNATLGYKSRYSRG